MRRILLLVGIFAAPLDAQNVPAPAQTPPPQIFIKAGRLIDGRSDQAQAGMGILIVGDRVKAVGPVAQIQAQAGDAKVIDLSQLTVRRVRGLRAVRHDADAGDQVRNIARHRAARSAG